MVGAGGPAAPWRGLRGAVCLPPWAPRSGSSRDSAVLQKRLRHAAPLLCPAAAPGSGRLSGPPLMTSITTRGLRTGRQAEREAGPSSLCIFLSDSDKGCQAAAQAVTVPNKEQCARRGPQGAPACAAGGAERPSGALARRSGASYPLCPSVTRLHRGTI